MSAQERAGRRLPVPLLHVTGAILVPLCLAAGVFEFSRARSGHTLAWGYTVEWPVIAGYGVYVWVRLARERARPARTASAPVRSPGEAPAPGSTPGSAPAPDADDPELAAWQAYLAELHASDPPGGPPPGGRRPPGGSTIRR